MRPQPMIAVTDVEASSRWYQRLLGFESAHGGPEYERLVHDGVLVMQLHHFEVDHHHGPIGDPADRPYGNGVLLWFEIDDFDAAMARVAELNPEIVLRATAIRRTDGAGPTTGSAGCATRTATRSSSQAPTAPRTERGGRRA